MNVDGRTVMITGATGGIGRSLALRMAAAGAFVAATDRDSASLAGLADELGGDHVALHCDVADEASMIGAIDAVEQRLGPVDIFCANAGVADGGDPVETPMAVFDHTLAVNVRSHVVAAGRLLPGWLERGTGYFLSVASAAGLLTQIGSAPYTVSKHAAVAFAEWLSVTYGERGLRVSCVCPMGVRTGMLVPGHDGALDEVGSRIVQEAGDVLEPDQVADMILESIEDERFLVLPHPEVLTFFQRKATDYERWLTGMRRLQRTTASATGGRAEQG